MQCPEHSVWKLLQIRFKLRGARRLAVAADRGGAGPGLRGAGHQAPTFSLASVSGSGGGNRRYFPLKLPITLEPGRAVFVFVDPGYDTATELCSWGTDHRCLWETLREQGRTVEVVAVAREHQALGRDERMFGRWAGDSGRGGSVDDPLAGREIARIEQAVLKGNNRVLDEYGSLQSALKRIVELKKRARKGSNKPIGEGFSTWRSRRDWRKGILSVDQDVSCPIGARTKTSGINSHKKAFRQGQEG